MPTSSQRMVTFTYGMVHNGTMWEISLDHKVPLDHRDIKEIRGQLGLRVTRA